MKYFLTFFIVLSTYYLFPTPTLAGHCVDGNPNPLNRYCDGGFIYEDQADCSHRNTGESCENTPPIQCTPNPAGSTFCETVSDREEVVKQVNSDCSISPPIQSCKLIDDQRCDAGACKIVYETKLYVDPSPDIGKEATITATSTQSCLTGLELNVGDGLRVGEFFERDCVPLTDMVCDGINPKNGYRCWVQFKCIGFQVGEFNAALNSPGNSQCNSSISYQVNEVQDCNPAGENVTTEDGDFSEQLVAQSLVDDLRNAESINKFLQPREINDQLVAKHRDEKLPEAAFQTGFFDKLFCANRIFAFIGEVTNLFYCPAPVNLNLGEEFSGNVFYNGKTDYNRDVIMAVSNAEKPSSLIPRPVKNSCTIRDANQGDIQTTGNRKYNDIQTSSGGRSGFYALGLPKELQDLKLKTNSPKNNASINKKALVGDERAPDINCKEQLYYQANFPSEIGPPTGGCEIEE